MTAENKGNLSAVSGRLKKHLHLMCFTREIAPMKTLPLHTYNHFMMEEILLRFKYTPNNFKMGPLSVFTGRASPCHHNHTTTSYGLFCYIKTSNLLYHLKCETLILLWDCDHHPSVRLLCLSHFSISFSRDIKMIPSFFPFAMSDSEEVSRGVL